MRWSIIILMCLSSSLACSKKEAPATAPAEPKQAAETETPPSAEGSEPTADTTADTPEDAAEDAAEEMPLPKELEGETPAIGAAPVLTVLEQGEQPRQALRWSVKPGFEQKVTAQVSFGVKAVIAIMAFGSPKYELTYDLTMRAKNVEDDGTVRVAFTVDEARSTDWSQVDEDQQAPLKIALKGAGETTGSYTLSPLGRASDIEITVPPGAGRMSNEMVDNLRWALAQMTPLLPKEPVGQGAKWTLHQGVEQGGIKVNQLTTLEIVKLEGSRVELAVHVQQTAAPQTFKNPGTAATLSLSIIEGKASFRGMAVGSLTWNLTELAPRAGKSESEVIKGARHRSGGGKAVSVAVKTDRTFEVIAK